jgi:hypothetical protein
VLGIRDELQTPGRINHLVTFYSSHQRWVHPDTRFTPQQYRWLFERVPRPSDPLAILFVFLGGVILDEFIKRNEASPNDLPFSTVSPHGSNSYGFHSIATHDNRVYLIGDEHQPKALYHVARFKARRGSFDGAGAITVGTPFPLFNVARDIAWAPSFGQADAINTLVYESEWDRKTYIDENGRVRNFRFANFSISLRTAQQTWQPVWFHEYYVQPDSSVPGNAPLKVLTVERRGAPRFHRNEPTLPGSILLPDVVTTKRIWGLEDGNPSGRDPRFEPLKLLYRLQRAKDAEDALSNAFGLLSTRHLNFVIASGIAAPGSNRPNSQVIALPTARCAYRYPAIPGDSSFVLPVFMSRHPEKKWGVHDTRLPTPPIPGAMFHPITDFPTLRLHDKLRLPLPSTNPQRPEQFHTTTGTWVVSNNVAPQWYFGRLYPFPTIDPTEELWRPTQPIPRRLFAFPASGTPTEVPYQQLPWFTTRPGVANVDASIASLALFHQRYVSRLTGNYAGGYLHPFHIACTGAMTIRQEWMVRLVRSSYESAIDPGISKNELKALITDCRDPFAYYLNRLHNYDTPPPGSVPRRFTWFEDLRSYSHERGTADLVDEFRTWSAETEGDTASTDPRFVLTPAKWVCFWHVFRLLLRPFLDLGIRPYSFDVPIRAMFPFPSENTHVKTAAKAALRQTLLVFSRYPQTLAAMQRVAVNYTGREFGAHGVPDSGRAVASVWIVEPIGSTGIGSLPSSPPKLLVVGGARLPIIVGLRKPQETSHSILLMSLAQPADDYTMPEWKTQPGLYEASVRDWAARKHYELPMVERHPDLVGFVYRSGYDHRQNRP